MPEEKTEAVAPKKRGRPPKAKPTFAEVIKAELPTVVIEAVPVVPTVIVPKKQIEEIPRGLTLCQYIPRVSPKFHAPTHFPELIYALECAASGVIQNGRYVVTVPMRHGKTYTCLHAIAWALKENPAREIMYISYGANFAQRNSRKARRYALASGVELSKDHNTIGEWLTEQGGSVLATGIDGEIAGRGADIIIIDDPIKSRVVAESYDEREKATDFVQEAISRLNVGGSVFLVSARWHVDDPSGQLLKTGEYTHIHHRAIIDEGLPTERALAPDFRPLEALKRTRHEVGQYNWASWYQGDPMPPDAALFRAVPTTYTRRPESVQYAIGIDLGFTKHGDASEAILLGRDGENVYVLDRQSWQKRVPTVAAGLMALARAYPSAPMFSFVSGPEIGAIDLLQQEPYGLDIAALPARYNKFVRAMPTADAWNAGKIKVPAVAPWDVKGFCAQVVNFTGDDGGTDNAVDALVSAFEALSSGEAVAPAFFGQRSM